MLIGLSYIPPKTSIITLYPNILYASSKNAIILYNHNYYNAQNPTNYVKCTFYNLHSNFHRIPEALASKNKHLNNILTSGIF